MQQFIAKQGRHVMGVLNGWDRIVFRGLYRLLSGAAPTINAGPTRSSPTRGCSA